MDSLGIYIGLLAACLVGGAGTFFGIFLWLQGRRADQRFRDALDAFPAGILVLDIDGHIRLANQHVEHEFGYAHGALVGQPVAALIPALENEHEWRAERPELVAAPKRRDYYGLRKDGTRLPLEVGFARTYGPHGDLVFVSVASIAERRELEIVLNRQRDELARMSQILMLNELSGSLAHELNQPLMAILINTQAALRHLDQPSLDKEELRAILADVVSDDKRASEVIKSLRAMFGKGDMLAETFDINALVEQTVKLLLNDLLRVDVRCSLHLAEQLPRVHAIRVQVQQVLINLIMNACDAMRVGHAAKDAARQPSKRSLQISTIRADHGVQVVVRDQGPGIADDKLEEVFEPFFTTKSQGIGLGLAVCRKIIASHGGKIWAANNSDGGASFNLTLPVIEEEVQYERAAS